jgi:hypothetical protein
MLRNIDAALHCILPRNAFAALLLRLTTCQARGLLSLILWDARIVSSIRNHTTRFHGIFCVHSGGVLIVSMI